MCKVWQLPPAKVRLGGRSWDKTFSRILATVTDGLGCTEAKVSAEFYKRLVHDEGSFFAVHRDTGKNARHVLQAHRRAALRAHGWRTGQPPDGRPGG